MLNHFEKVGININDLKDHKGYTGLHLASRQNHMEVAKLLLEHNSEVNILAETGKTPLCIALEYNHDVTTVLLDTIAEGQSEMPSTKG